MKKKFLLIFCFFLTLNLSFSQALKKEDFVVEFQMGYPNLSYWKSGYSGLFRLGNPNINNNDIHKSIGQFVFNSEFFLTDKIGLALGFNYGYYYDYYETEIEEYDQNTQQFTVNTYFSEKKTHRYRIYIGPNFHLIRTERLDSYLGLKVGIKRYNINRKDNFPENGSYYNFSDIEFEIPVGLRVSYGLRYFFTESLALSTEFGLGGPMLTFGLTYRVTNKKHLDN